MTETTTTTPTTPGPQKIDLPADASWPELCVRIIRAHGGVATKRQINAALEGHPKTEGRKFWRYAVSRTVQYDKPNGARGRYGRCSRQRNWSGSTR